MTKSGCPAYMDTNALLGWARARTGKCINTEAAIASFVQPLLHGCGRITAISEITLIEFYDNITHWYRKGEPGATISWHDSVNDEVMLALSRETVEVLPLEPKVYEKAMRYVRLAAVPDKRKFKAMDAAHLVHAVGWARRRNEKVDLISADDDFQRLINKYPAFQRFITQVDPITGLDRTSR